MHDATALNETRTLSFHHTHSGEDLTVTFKRDGRYDEEALKKLNQFLRDWRSQDQTTMDRHLFDILWEVYRDVDGKKPIQIISAYRSPATNSMLRRRSSGVARFSQHMLGHAMDFYIPDVPLEQIRAAGLRLQRGGVGFYPTSGSPFVHLDTGSVRHWPRMTHDQLARVFPDGRTVHLPSNGGPMKGYELARADIERRGNGDDAATVGKMPNLFASLFKSGKATTKRMTRAPALPPRTRRRPAAAPPPSRRIRFRRRVPSRRSQPLCSWPRPTPRSCRRPKPSLRQSSRPRRPPPTTAEPKPQTPADIINSRGFWDDPPAAANQATPAQVAALRAREALAAATDPQPTSSVSEAFKKALAYAPAASSPADRANVVTASAPMPRSPPVRRATRMPPRPRSTPWSPRARRVRTARSQPRARLAAAPG